MKRTVIFGALVLALMLVISACGSPATPAPAPTQAPQPTTAPAQPTSAPQPTTAPTQPTTAPAPTSASAVTDEWGTVTVKKGDTIKVGFSGALTGDLAPFGLDMQVGAQMAAKDFGTNVVPGFNIEIVSEDDQCSGPGSTTVANKFAA